MDVFGLSLGCAANSTSAGNGEGYFLGRGRRLYKACPERIDARDGAIDRAVDLAEGVRDDLRSVCACSAGLSQLLLECFEGAVVTADAGE